MYKIGIKRVIIIPIRKKIQILEFIDLKMDMYSQISHLFSVKVDKVCQTF